jgi:hypothetical protein
MVAIRRLFRRTNLDVLGFSASAICALHCLAVPRQWRAWKRFAHPFNGECPPSAYAAALIPCRDDGNYRRAIHYNTLLGASLYSYRCSPCCHRALSESAHLPFMRCACEQAGLTALRNSSNNLTDLQSSFSTGLPADSALMIIRQRLLFSRSYKKQL